MKSNWNLDGIELLFIFKWNNNNDACNVTYAVAAEPRDNGAKFAIQ